MSYPVFGGPHNHVMRLARPLAGLGIDVTAVVPAGSPAQARLEAAGVRTEGVAIHRLRATREARPHFELVRHLRADLRGLRGAFRTAEADIVVQATLVPPHAALAARLEGLPVVWQVVDTRSPSVVRRPSMRVLAATASLAMFTGEAVRRQHVGTQEPGFPTEVFFPPVDTGAFVSTTAARAATRDAEGIPTAARVVGMVANINPMKGWEYFVRAAGLLYRDRPDLYFLMVGAVHLEHREYLAALEEEMGVSGVPRDRFVLTGARDDVPALLSAMDLQLITSLPRSEGAPTAGLEGMSCGLPIVAVDVAAISEFVADGVTGFVVPPLNPSALAGAAGRCLDDANLRKRLGARARRAAVERYGLEVSASRHVQLFADVAERHAAAPDPAPSWTERLTRPAHRL